jgi:FtsP/CotA-like multicopper oxidase with cupredoxin domain
MNAASTRSALSGDMMNYDWTINGRPFADTEPLTIRQGQRATLTFTNMSTMWHPMHLHGHTFQVIRPDGSLGARKDTAVVLPMHKLGVALVADNPGVWMLHCHNTYYQEAWLRLAALAVSLAALAALLINRRLPA